MSKQLYGVIATSSDQNEQRLPINPELLLKIPRDIRNSLVFEAGYGESFGISDEKIASLTAGVVSRQEILENIGNIILLAPSSKDLAQIKEGGTIWGWTNCVRDKEIAQLAIDKKLTLISFESMFSCDNDEKIKKNVFHEANELAGYSAVLHALSLKGIDGRYGNQKKILVIGFGSVSRGAIHALLSREYKDITVCTRYSIATLPNVIKGCKYITAPQNISDSKKFVELLNKSDIIVNGISQDLIKPTMFIKEKDLEKISPKCLVIDLSCNEGMGFFFAKPTTLNNPMFKVGTIDYYGVNHASNYLWDSATRSISKIINDYLANITLTKENKSKIKVLSDATDIKDGLVKNKKIISFQKREKEYPYNYKS
ncbi:N(5)-(carboxyethyl)ornithine synthase [Francisella philomiragia]|uniref:N(5)-(carboxyethyl)ornithine synthase n=1 Tax=Francisella philomiragia TaxID=28110 RepID=UPI000B590E73|nr:N(5)-(carboxyethyl)ornithine synthase [Francisella philomiragia]MBK2093749.1 saccharopine dehydrogenase NADP-binding domain-containing protein [Francisella philomiragia]MBK2095175.1 saccharopine dehydrogenase NADP-binding domain-containing protein [Francisella philomiragia]MBK2256219.1 saccharopine dehydrogenase NADP-binding domain-containing protein [Francisella philomiragia]MBK2268877.1 saccharopine dehydrogenase NADP-binding domain-containing protein [Francisella philomiragia]MBK2270648.